MGSLLEESKKSKKTGFFGRFKKYIIIAIVVMIAGGVGDYFYSNKKTAATVVVLKNATVKKQDLMTSVQSNGKVVAESGVDLSFSVSGSNLEVQNVYVKEGDNVKKGDKIATVKTDSLELNYRSAYASYLSALADYNQTVSGATAKQIADAKAKIDSAKISLDQSNIALANTTQSAQKSIFDAQQSLQTAQDKLNDNQNELTSKDVKNAYGNLVDAIKSTNILIQNILADSDKIIGVDDKLINDSFESYLGVKSVGSMNDAIGSYNETKSDLVVLNSSALVLNENSSYSDIDKASTQANTALSAAEKHLYSMQTLLDNSIVSTGFTQATLDGLKADVSSNRSSVNSKITSIRSSVKAVDDAKDNLKTYVENYNSAKVNLDNANANAQKNIQNSQNSVKSAQLNVDQAQRDYNDLIAPLTTAESQSAQSKLTSSSVNLAQARDDLDKATIISPIDGVVSSLGYKAGDIIVNNTSGTNTPVATIVNENTLYVEVNVEEADISKIKLNQKAYITFDALSSMKIEGTVSFISLTSKTDSSGIVTYLVRVVFTNNQKVQVREGMTSTVDFVLAEAPNVLIVPVAAVTNVNGSPSVTLETGEIKPVTTGFTDGKNVEVISGLAEGDKITY